MTENPCLFATFSEPARAKRLAWKSRLAGPITTRWNVSAFPAVYVIDSKGVIRFRNNLPPKIMERAIHQLIKETDDAPKK